MSEVIGDTLTKETTNLFNFNDLGNEKQYAVIFHNDDVTPFEFVIIALVVIFNKNEKDAVDLTMNIHMSGKGVVGTYSLDEAYQRVDALDLFKKEAGYDLLVTVEEVE